MLLSRLKISVTSTRRIFAACSKNKIRNHSSEDRARPRKAPGADEESRLLGVRSHNEGQITVGVDGNGGSSRLRFDGTIFAGQFEQRGRHCLLPEGRLDGCHLRSMVGLSPRVTFVVMRSRQRRARWCCFGVTRLDVRWKRASTAVLLSQGLYLGPECLGLNGCRLRWSSTCSGFGRRSGGIGSIQKRLGPGNVDWSGAVGEAVLTISDD